jgi:tetratricopeptide (TPR) repeat protein
MLAKYEDAVKNYTTYLQQSPESGDGFFWRGNSYYKLNQMSQAISDVNKALEIDPTNETYLTFKKDTLKK